MPRIRLNPLDAKEIVFEGIPGENLKETYDRILKESKIPNDEKLEEFFEISMEGHIINRGLWCHVKPKNHNMVLISIVPRGGGDNQGLRTALTIAVVIGAAYFTGQLANPGTWQYVAYMTTFSTIGMMAVNAIVPPPELDIGGLGIDAGYDQEKSQMYSITSQANSAKKYGTVPRVYGRHRIFPVVATSPYTEIEVSSENGELVQFFYAVYDFGFGPLTIEDVKIGDTPINDFNIDDVGEALDTVIAGYRLVDFNRPIVSEGDWDQPLENNLIWYKGDNNLENVGVVLNKDSTNPNALPSQYQAVRSAAPDVANDKQEIHVNLVFPRGLVSYATNGNKDKATVDVRVEFAEVGTENWLAYNDESVVSNFSLTGTDIETDRIYRPGARMGFVDAGNSVNLVGVTAYSRDITFWDLPDNIRNADPVTSYIPLDENKTYKRVEYYRTRGQNQFYHSGSWSINLIGYKVLIDDNFIGKVTSQSQVTIGGYTYTKFGIDSGISSALLAHTMYYAVEDRVGPEYHTGKLVDSDAWVKRWLEASVGNKNPLPCRPYLYFHPPGSGLVQVAGKKSEPVYGVVKFEPKQTGIQYKVRVTRLSSNSIYTYRIDNEMTWSTINTRFDRTPITTDKRHVFLELKIKATDQLNGTIKNLSAIASSVLDVYDPNTSTWSKQLTGNPAWVYVDALTGNVNKRPLPKSRLDTDSLVEWAEYCDEIPPDAVNKSYKYKRFETNFILDYKATVQSLITQVCGAAQASFNLVNGKYGVLIDKNKVIPIQVFTPRNSNQFSMTRNYTPLPHAFKIKYVDRVSNWELKETIVYNSGYDIYNATEFEELSTFACTNDEQAWRFGRYMLFQGTLRRETYSLTVDFEYLICTRGDYVKIQHDAIKGGGLPTRVKSVIGNEITIDDGFVGIGGAGYAYEFRKTSTGEFFSGSLTITSSTTGTVIGEIPGSGDLLIWGEPDKTTIDCLVKSIMPQDDLKAQLILVEKQDGVYDYETSGDLPVYSSLISQIGDLPDEAPGLVQSPEVFENTWRCGVGEYEYYISLLWGGPQYGVADKYEVYKKNGTGYELVAIVKENTFEYIVSRVSLDSLHEFKILAVSSLGQKKALGDAQIISAIPLTKTDPPQDVSALYSNIVSETIQLEWTPVSESCIQEFLIRYSKNFDAKWESSIPVDRVDGNSLTTSLSARSGAYFIKAIDYEGNESVNSAKVITSIPELSGLNLVESINDFDVLDGAYNQVVRQGDTLLLQESISGLPEDTQYHTEGFYNYKDFLDLGEIYTVRLQSLIEAEGYTIGDLIAAWVTLSDVDAMSTTSTSDWDVETQVRTRETFLKMSNWVTLSAIDPISEGDQTQWGAWRKFTIGDFTGRIFQFRLRLLSNKASVTPRVIDGLIKADMPDRDIRIDNMTTVAATLSINFNNYGGAYYGPGTKPLVQITQEDAQKGDRFVVTNKTLNGFDITFYDINDVVVARTFDALIKGYGRKTNEVI